MKKAIIPLVLCLSMLFSVPAFANDGLENVTGSTAMINQGYVQCDYCGAWVMNGNEFRNHMLACPVFNADYEPVVVPTEAPSYVQCTSCGGWYLSGNEFRNHICSGNSSAAPSSTWTTGDYYEALLRGETVGSMAPMGSLYVNTANGNNLNMRSRPNTDCSVVTSIPNGSSVTVYWYENSSWVYVSWNGSYGFCSTRYLSTSRPSTSTSKPASNTASTGSSAVSATTEKELAKMFENFAPANYYVAVKPFTPTGAVNLRWAPSKSAPVICVYYSDTVLKVLASDGNWSQVLNESTGVCGYMSNTYLNRYLY